MYKRLLIAAAAASFAAMPAQAVNLVTNGGFETGDFTGWEQFNDTSFTGVSGEFGGVLPPEGEFQAFFGPLDPGGGGISQFLATTPGASYNVSFLLANLGGPPNAYGVFWDGAFVDIFFDNDAFPYFFASGTLIASTASTELALVFFHEPSYFLVDDVIVEAAIPEPATWGLMIAGFTMTGAALRRRRIALAA